jgi:ceramide synthetase
MKFDICFSLLLQDLTQMVTHHLVTIALVFFSFVVNFVRVGTLVLCVHDAVDYFLAVSRSVLVWYITPMVYW